MERAPPQKKKNCTYSKIRHQSFNVGKKQSETRSEREASTELAHFPASGGVRLLNVWNNLLWYVQKSWQRLCRLAKVSQRFCIFYNLHTVNATAGRDARHVGRI